MVRLLLARALMKLASLLLRAGAACHDGAVRLAPAEFGSDWRGIGS